MVACIGMAVAGCSIPFWSQGPVTIESREIKSQTEALVLNMKIPVVSGVKDEKLQSRINAELENAALRDKEEITRLSKFAERVPDVAYELHWEYQVFYNKHGILSLTTIADQFTGGAHGMSVRRPYNYDINAGKKMALADVFQPGVDYKTIINQEIEKQIESRPEYFFEGELGFRSIADNQDYYLEDGNLMVYFGQYDIAPYSSGIPEFKIPFSRFDGGVRSDLLK